MPRYSSGGLSLAYDDLGQGPALILLHGWGSNGAVWEYFGWISEVGQTRRLLIPDLRGHGSSAKPHDPAAYPMDQFAADVLALMDVAGLQEADLLGYSMGGLVALWTIVLAPARVRALVAGGVSNQPTEWMAIGPPLRGASPMTPEAEASQALALQVPGNDLDALAACLEAGPAPPPCPELAVFGGEALIAVGSRDPHFEASTTVAQCLPGGRFLPLEDVDHNSAFADPRFKKAVLEFLDEVSPL